MNEDPRLILGARRPDGSDDSDPEIAATLAAAQADPQLSEWAAKESEVDGRLSAALRSVQPPHGLRDRILTGARVSRKETGSRRGWFEQKVFGIFQRGEIAAVAAVVALLAIAVVFNRVSDVPDERPWQVFATAKAAEFESGITPLEREDTLFETTAIWMREKACPAPHTLPEGLQGLGLFGCSTMTWNGKPVGIVCFKLDAKREVHLVSINVRDIPETLSEKPVWTEVSGYTTAQWRENDTAYMLMGRVPRAELEPLLAKKTALRRSHQDRVHG